MTLRNAGVLRKLPDDDDLYLTIDGTRLNIKGEAIPRLLEGHSQPLYDPAKKPAAIIKLWRRYGFEDLIEIVYQDLSYVVRKDRFLNVWNGSSPCCGIYERVPDIWQGFKEVTA